MRMTGAWAFCCCGVGFGILRHRLGQRLWWRRGLLLHRLGLRLRQRFDHGLGAIGKRALHRRRQRAGIDEFGRRRTEIGRQGAQRVVNRLFERIIETRLRTRIHLRNGARIGAEIEFLGAAGRPRSSSSAQPPTPTAHLRGTFTAPLGAPAQPHRPSARPLYPRRPPHAGRFPRRHPSCAPGIAGMSSCAGSPAARISSRTALSLLPGHTRAMSRTPPCGSLVRDRTGLHAGAARPHRRIRLELPVGLWARK